MRDGFSLVEMTIAMAIMLAITGALFAMMNPAYGVFLSQPEAIDMQQRVRVVVDAVSRDLMMAGAGIGMSVAPVLPMRRGPLSPDPPGVFLSDRITIMYAPVAGASTTVGAPTDAGSAVYVSPQAGCPPTGPLCGFAANTLVAVLDQTGAYDTFRVAAVQETPPALISAGGTLSKSYAPGAAVLQVVSSTYWLRQDAATGTSELMHYDGRQTDLPMADGVTGLTFEYYGDPLPPELRGLPGDADGQSTSYGPPPPAMTTDDPATPAYGAGENCLFTVADGATVVRPEMRNLGTSPSLARLSATQLSDGPWCPDPSAPNRFDADLLRIRRVRVTVRVRALRVFLEAPLADRQITFDVMPRNPGLTR